MIVPTGELRSAVSSAISGFACGAKDPDGVVQVRMNNLTTDGHWDWASVRRVPPAKAKSRHYLEPGDVLFNATNSPQLVGKSACFVGYGEPVVFSNHFVRLRPDSARMDSSFLTRWLNVLWQEGLFETRCKRWVNQASFSKDELLALPVPLPPLPEQKRIAAILDAADELRAKRRESIAQLDTLLQSVFLDMFGDPVTNPKGWEVLGGSELADRITVGVVVKPASYYVDDGVPALRSLNVRPNRIELDDVVYFPPEVSRGKLKKSELSTGDVVMVRSGKPGTAAVVPDSLDGSNAIDILIFTPDRKAVLPEYICHFMNSSGGHRAVFGVQRGQIQKHLNVGSLRKMAFPVPPLEEQRRWLKRTLKIEELKLLFEAHLSELDTLFASLQSCAFRGEL